MRRILLLTVGLTAGLAGGVMPASAQFLQFSWGDAMIAPHRVPAIVRGMGMDPAGPVFREGGAYSIQAIDPTGQRVRVVLDARDGATIAVERLGPPDVVARAAPPPANYRGPGVYLDDDEDEMPRARISPAPRVQQKPVDKPVAKKPDKPPAVAARPSSPDIIKMPEPAPVVIPQAVPSAVAPPAPPPAAAMRTESGASVTPLPGGQGVRIVGPQSPYEPRKPAAGDVKTPPASSGTPVPAANGLDFD